ncbi:hypothetical protein FFLO_06049 [Filobasidium floriforme]|uniref:Apple domain-containing protein n=1 Tax=Filobasidium floriforme TaxID=5210 RepID=A0A8K0NQT7_9TREE|nr:uncharacterized protein HD553DRAFT_83156 [Filobasidium floriforme]KAG7528595.1 hypothetical protein FFLO_06049 [Filobasidium floriforme]KAH8081511.1 hypothetical protein HD553DRAFT_83156 [Filobasidium floriforme]
MVKLLNVAAILVSCVGLVHAVPMEEVQWSIWHDVAPEWNEAAVLIAESNSSSYVDIDGCLHKCRQMTACEAFTWRPFDSGHNSCKWFNATWETTLPVPFKTKIAQKGLIEGRTEDMTVRYPKSG